MSVVSAVVELVYAGNPHSASVLAATAAAAGWDGRLGAAEGDRVRLAEGPLWEASTDTLYFIDILGKKLHALHIAAAEAAGDKPAVSGHREWTLPELPGTVCLTEKSGVLLVAMQDGLYLFDTHTGQCVHSGVDCEPGVGANRCNDGKVDPSGRLVVGTMCLDEGPEGQHKGGLYSVDGSRGEWTSRRLLSGLSIPNGLAWTRDGATFFHTDTPARLIKRYAYDAATGEVGEGQPAIQLTEEFGAGPDGLTIDEEDKLWVASWGGGRVCRFDPSTGALLFALSVGGGHVSRVSSCAFGGRHLSDLYITTAAPSEPFDYAAEGLAGSVFVARNLGVRGRLEPPFKGALHTQQP